MYGDDIVLVMKKTTDLKEMLKSFSNFLEKKRLILSIEDNEIKNNDFPKKSKGILKEKWFWNRDRKLIILNI